MIRIRLAILLVLLPTVLAFSRQKDGKDSLRAMRSARLDSLVREACLRVDSSSTKNWLDRELNIRDIRAKAKRDSLYISKPDYRWTVKLRGNSSGTTFRARRTYGDYRYNVGLNSNVNVTTAISFNYRGLAAALSLNPLKLSGKNTDMEFNINAYGNKFGADFIYIYSKTLKGTFTQSGLGEQDYAVSAGQVQQQLLAINGYYSFNHRRFSYPAAFTQSQLQLRSCGSWMLGFSFMGSYLHFDKDLLPNIPEIRLRMVYFGIGGGYGYNLVTSAHWLFHISAMPELVVATYGRMKTSTSSDHTPFRFPNLINVGRLAIVKNYSKTFFGLSAVVNTSLTGDREQLLLHQTKWRGRIFWGFRLK